MGSIIIDHMCLLYNPFSPLRDKIISILVTAVGCLLGNLNCVVSFYNHNYTAPPPPPIPLQLCRMRRHISLLQLQRHAGLHELPLQHKQELVAMCLHHFRAGLRLGVEFRDTSCQPADYYIILAVHLKIELYHETG